MPVYVLHGLYLTNPVLEMAEHVDLHVCNRTAVLVSNFDLSDANWKALVKTLGDRHDYVFENMLAEAKNMGFEPIVACGAAHFRKENLTLDQYVAKSGAPR